MTLVVKVDGVALPDGALVIGDGPNSNLPGGVQGLPLAAYYGESLTGGYSIDDPDGDYEFTSLHTITAEETSATNPFITGGWITTRGVSRGIYKSGVSRVWNMDFIDINWNYSLMVFRASSAKRPYETDLVRAQFIRESAPMAYTPSYDNGRFNVTDNPINFDESDLVGKYPIEAFNEFVGIAGKNFYNYWDPTADQISIHYDLIGTGPTAALTISNDMADTSSTCFYPFLDATLEMGPAYKVTGMLLKARGFNAYGIRQATIDELGPSIFSPDGLQRDEVYSSERFGRLASAQAAIQSMLAQRAEDTDTIKVSIRVPAEMQDGALPGQVITVKFTHLPGYEEDTPLPIIRRNVIPSPGRTDFYDLHLELSGAGKPTGPGGGDPGPFPEQPPEPCVTPVLENFASGNIPGSTCSWGDGQPDDFTPTAGNVLVLGVSSRNGHTVTNIPTSAPGGAPWSYLGGGFAGGGGVGFTDSLAWYMCISDGTETGMFQSSLDDGVWVVYELSGVDPTSASTGTLVTATGTDVDASVTCPAGTAVFVALAAAASGDTAVSYTPDVGWTETVDRTPSSNFHPHFASAYQLIASASATESPGMTLSGSRTWHAQAVTIFCTDNDTGPTCPGAGVPNARPEIVTLTGADGTTRCPFADGTLRVFIDATEQTDGLVSTNGVTGDFTLGFDPTPTEVCTVEYLGR